MTMHLNAEALVDIAEGARPESSAPHLAVCEACRGQLQDLRAMMSAAEDVSVPEPSPLFWDHLSSRVSEAVAADAGLKSSRSFGGTLAALLGARALQASVAAAAALVLTVVLGSRMMAPAPAPAPDAMSFAAAAPPASRELLGDASSDDDASLRLVASLADGLDLDSAREAGLTSRGSAEHAVTHLSDGELRELRRLLQEELSRSGA